jgi:hypothetical protein
MSQQSPFGGRAAQMFPAMPKGDVLGTYETYPEAQRVVAQLAASDFPVGRVAIVGNDLKTVERVTGKLTYGRAAAAGAITGLWLGLFFGIVMSLFSSSGSGVWIAAAIIGAAFGMLYGVVSFSVTKRLRDFTSVHQVLASNYQIVVDPQLTAQAQQVLSRAGTATGRPQQFGQQQPPFGGGPFSGGPGVGGPGAGGPGWPGNGNGGAPQYRPPQGQPTQPPRGQYQHPPVPQGQPQQPPAPQAPPQYGERTTQPSSPSAGGGQSPYGSAWGQPTGAPAAPASPEPEARQRPRYGEMAPEPGHAPTGATPAAGATAAPGVTPAGGAPATPGSAPAAPGSDQDEADRTDSAER